MKNKHIVLLISCIVLSQLVGLLGSVLSIGTPNDWYSQLEKSSLSPSALFATIAWVVMFLLLGISLYLVLLDVVNNKKINDKLFNRAMAVLIIQWILNIAWSFIFFYVRSASLAMLDLVALIFAVIILMYYFYRLRPLAAYLLIPYLVWLLFDAYMNLVILQLN
ncbi:MAG: tryptophan-rich sensory protein [Candidatus Falkowbacteria bacterium]|nr:tryptophan-rich sensory protein [Candidatus Falkowbacteria bacterium]